MPKDTLYQNNTVTKDFQFNKQVAEVFDDMLHRSVPCYGMVIGMIARLLERFGTKGDPVYDLGCSTGNTLIELARRLGPMQMEFVGIDNSAAMIEKARLKAEMYSKSERVRFIEADISEAETKNAGAVICNYTLQFIRPMRRTDFVRKIYDSLRPGGVLIVSEKTIFHDPALNRAFIDFYLQFKREQGYSELEIARKREALENVLIPFSIKENRQLLEAAGFTSVETFFQWFNFVSFVAIK